MKKSMFYILLLMLMVACKFKPGPAMHPHTGKPFPDYNLAGVEDTTQHFSSTMVANKPSVVMFVLPDCPYSRAQAKELRKNLDKMGDVELVIVSPIREGMDKFMNEVELAGKRQVIAGIAPQLMTDTSLHIGGVPVTFVNDGKGLVVAAFNGPADYGEIKSYFTPNR